MIETLRRWNKLKKEASDDVFSRLFIDFNKNVSFEETISKNEVLERFPWLSCRTFNRYQTGGAFKAVVQRVSEFGRGKKGWTSRYVENKIVPIIERIDKLRDKSKHELVAMIIELETKLDRREF